MTATPESANDDGRDPFSARLLPGGTEPDPRFTLANERTFLAWIRTALAIMAGGIALEAFAGEVFDSPWRTIVAVALIAFGVALSAGAFFRWLRVERAMRDRKPLPLPIIAPLLAAAVAVAAVVVLVLALT